MTKTINLILGGAGIGDSYKTVEQVTSLLDTALALGITALDTAPGYPVINPGESERLLGAAEAVKRGFVLETKVWSGSTTGMVPGCNKPTAIRESLETSLKRLGVDKLHTYFCHVPDFETPVVETVRTFDELHKEGKFEEWGVSNFPPSMVEEVMTVCTEHGYLAPAVFEGGYNAILRGSEDDLFPVLRKHNIRFNAYGPLGGGFFTGNLTRGTTEGTRMQAGDPSGDILRSFYDRPAIHEAFKLIQGKIEPLGISGPEAGIRWIVFHSGLQDGDGVILGASKPTQLEANVAAIKKGPLSDEVVASFEEVKKLVKT